MISNTVAIHVNYICLLIPVIYVIIFLHIIYIRNDNIDH